MHRLNCSFNRTIVELVVLEVRRTVLLIVQYINEIVTITLMSWTMRNTIGQFITDLEDRFRHKTCIICNYDRVDVLFRMPKIILIFLELSVLYLAFVRKISYFFFDRLYLTIFKYLKIQSNIIYFRTWSGTYINFGLTDCYQDMEIIEIEKTFTMQIKN